MKMTGFNALRVTVVAFLSLIWTPHLSAQPDQIMLGSSKVFEEKTRPAVPFPHNRHAEAGLSCKDCHHLYKDGKNVLEEGTLEEGKEGIRCFACHQSNSRPSLDQAFHDQCIGCHRKALKENKKTGPRFCGGCHIKKR